MPELRIPMDPMNPGQFFACCGLWELFDLRGARAMAHFEVDHERPRRGEFVVKSGQELLLAEAIRELHEARLEVIEQAEEKIRPISFEYGGKKVELDWWLDRFRDHAGEFKCWAGQLTSVNIASELIQRLPTKADAMLLSFSVMTKKRFGVDPRSAWNAADVGYSPDKQNEDAATFPAVEMLAAVGLCGFRPEKRKGEYAYALWLAPLPRAVARLACCAPWEGLPVRAHRFKLGKRGSNKFFRFSQAEERSDNRS